MVLKETKLPGKYFGEWLAVLNGKIYQLTYREKTGFIYNQATLKLERTFAFNSNEGLGMTTDGKNLIYDVGGSELHFLDPNTLTEIKSITVKDENGTVDRLNELEYIKGFIYANRWETDNIYKIDPANGKVVGVIDLSDLRQKTGIPAMSKYYRDAPEVLNGIAYDAATDRIFITGKYWPRLFEIRLAN